MMLFLEHTLLLVSAMVLGALIGIERQRNQRLAGIQTNALVASGAAMFVLVAQNVTGEVSPTRIAAQVASGIGFLGAGVIIRDGLNIRGINTAATLWCAAAVGVLAGSGFLALAAAGAATVLIANLVLRPMKWKLEKHPEESAEPTQSIYFLRLIARMDAEARLRSQLLNAVQQKGLLLHWMHSEDDEHPKRIIISAELAGPVGRENLIEAIVAQLSLDDAVSRIGWEQASGNERTSPFASSSPLARN